MTAGTIPAYSVRSLRREYLDRLHVVAARRRWRVNQAFNEALRLGLRDLERDLATDPGPGDQTHETKP